MPSLFDTHRLVRRLEAAGVPQAQAEAITDALHESAADADLVTRKDLEQAVFLLRQEMATRFERIDGELKLNRWMLGIIILAQVTPWLAKLFRGV